MSENKKRKCPCGSGVYFNECCEVQKIGQTPEAIKRLVKRCVHKSFERLNISRGDSCLYVANLTKELLSVYNTKSYVVAGSSKWTGFPVFYDWKPYAKKQEFHAWVITQFGEIVDLSCDAFYSRPDVAETIAYKLRLAPPTECWIKNPIDREYIPKDLGAKSFPFDKKIYKKIKDIAFNLHNRYSDGIPTSTM